MREEFLNCLGVWNGCFWTYAHHELWYKTAERKKGKNGLHFIGNLLYRLIFSISQICEIIDDNNLDIT